MDFHDALKLAGGIGALALYVPMAVQFIKDGGAGQSFATWFLWAALDTILTVSLFLQHGNYLLPLGFATGGIALTILLLVKGRFAWSRTDTVFLMLVVGCLAGWKAGGARAAMVAAALAICLAGIPGLLELWRNPQRKVAYIWGWYVVANGLSFLGGTAMTMEERFAPAVFAIFSALMVVAGYRRKPAVGSG